MTLLDFLVLRLRSSRRRAKGLLDRRAVWVNRRRIWMARHRVAPGDEVEVVEAVAGTRSADLPLTMLYEDDHFLVVNKPPGICSNGARGLEELLAQRTGNPHLRAAHRLDRDTSGCLLLAKTDRAFEHAADMIRERQVLKLYHALVAGCLRTPGCVLDRPLDGTRAVTRIRTLDANRLATHLGVQIETGRTHQIRRHLAAIHHPVLGDRQYGGAVLAADAYRSVPRQMLHAGTLEFRSPETGLKIRVEAPLPRDFRECLRVFRLT